MLTRLELRITVPIEVRLHLSDPPVHTLAHPDLHVMMPVQVRPPLSIPRNAHTHTFQSSHHDACGDSSLSPPSLIRVLLHFTMPLKVCLLLFLFHALPSSALLLYHIAFHGASISRSDSLIPSTSLYFACIRFRLFLLCHATVFVTCMAHPRRICHITIFVETYSCLTPLSYTPLLTLLLSHPLHSSFPQLHSFL